MNELIEGKDFYWEGALMVFTSEFHLRKGECCGSGCRHCPYEPKWTKGTTTENTKNAKEEARSRNDER